MPPQLRPGDGDGGGIHGSSGGSGGHGQLRQWDHRQALLRLDTVVVDLEQGAGISAAAAAAASASATNNNENDEQQDDDPFHDDAVLSDDDDRTHFDHSLDRSAGGSSMGSASGTLPYHSRSSLTPPPPPLSPNLRRPPPPPSSGGAWSPTTGPAQLLSPRSSAVMYGAGARRHDHHRPGDSAVELIEIDSPKAAADSKHPPPATKRFPNIIKPPSTTLSHPTPTQTTAAASAAMTNSSSAPTGAGTANTSNMPSTRKLSLAYLQDPSILHSTTLHSHVDAALRLRHARLANITLSFLDREVEDDYTGYFWTRSMTRWRSYIAAAGTVVLAFQIALLLGKGGDGITSAASISEWATLAVVGMLPMIAIGLSSFYISPRILARGIHHLSFIFLVLIGPVLTLIRYSTPRGGSTAGDGTPSHLSIPPATTAPIYIVSLVSSVFFLRLRFIHTLLATIVAAPAWYIVFGAEIRDQPELTAQYIVSSLALFLACIVTCCIAYDLERSIRTQYLSDSRFLSITKNLQSQLDGLERSLLAASGRNDLTPADLDSPLEKAMLAIRSLLLDHSIRREHRQVLDLVMACLSSPNLLTPDLDRQVKGGEVVIDGEVEKWLFSEVARRKRVSGANDPDEVGLDQVIPPVEDSDILEDCHDVTLEVPASVITAADVLAASNAAAVATEMPTSIIRRRSSTSTPLVITTMFDAASISQLCTSRTVALLSRMSDFNFPIFHFADSVSGHPLLVMAHHLCVTQGLVGRLGLSVERFVNCMATIEAGYHSELAFHNSLHAADVLHCINYLLNLPTISTVFTDLERLSILLAAIIHDFDHPGVNNHFLIASSDRRALLYNDKSVLENHHCAAAFEVLSRKECAFLSTLDRADYKSVREGVVEMVLATDLAQHFSLLTMFKKKVLSAPDTFDPAGTREDRTLLMQMLMKCADVSNPTKAWPEYSEWISRITEEWFTQGDREKALGLPVSPFCNRDGTTLTNPAPSQSSFINFIVAPLFDAFGAWTDLGEVRRGLDANKAKWAAVIAADKAKEDAEKAAAARKNAMAVVAFPVMSPPRPRRNRSFPALPGLTTTGIQADDQLQPHRRQQHQQQQDRPSTPTLTVQSATSPARRASTAHWTATAPSTPSTPGFLRNAFHTQPSSPLFSRASSGRQRRPSGPGWLTLDEAGGLNGGDRSS